MINYIIQVILFQTLFLAVYDLFLSKETFFTKNRFYLMATAIVSFILPLLRIPTLQKAVPQEYTILLPEIVLSPQKVIEKSAWYENIDYLQVLFWFGVAVFTVAFLIKLFTILKMIFGNEIHQKKNYKLVLLPKNSRAFSFFNYIFLGREIPQEKQAKIIEHELVHSKQKHSLDLLFFELLKIVMWFNPMIYIYQKRITLIHEYISDEVATKSEEKNSYINNLLSEIFQVEHISFINQFYKQSLIKKRISMITKNKSKRIQQLKYLLLVPVLASMLLYTACSDDNSMSSGNIESKKEPKTFYTFMNNELSSKQSETKESYLDAFLSTTDKLDYPEVNYNDLSKEEKLEYDERKNKMTEIFSSSGSKNVMFKIKVLQMPNGRRAIAMIPDFKKIMSKYNNKSDFGDDVPFSIINKVPTFPGCSDGDKDCFKRSMRKFVQENFDVNIANNLGLEPGKKRVYIQFKIAKDGKITDVKARAPHPKLKEEALRIGSILPTMKPGEHNGRKVKVGYTLPITFNIK